MLDNLMTTDEMASYLKVHVVTVYKLLEGGEIPAIRVGRSWRFKKETIDDWLNKKEKRSLFTQEKTQPKVSSFMDWDSSIINLERREEELFDVFNIKVELSATVYRPK